MTTLARPAYGPGRLARLGRFLLNGSIGTVLCLGPVTAILALGWLTRRMGHTTRSSFGLTEEAPGWLLGPIEANGRIAGRISRALGGLGANIRAGMITLAALLVWTLPFTLLWLGTWWAGWENSFNKGYEQAFVGPSVYFVGVLIAAMTLPALPIMLAHLATEDRLSAAFELRRLRSAVAQAGWRIPALAILTTAFAALFAAARGLVTTATDWAPWLEDLSSDEIAGIKGQIALGLAAWAFLSLWILRHLAACIYRRAALLAAGLKPGLWDGALATEAAGPAKPPARTVATFWYVLAMAVMLAFSFLILSGQFLDHAWWRWIFHPFLTLPWPG